MRYLSIIRAVERQGAPPQGLLEAIDRYVTKSSELRELVFLAP